MLFLHMTTWTILGVVYSLVPRLWCRGGGREPGTLCLCMRHVSLVTCILLCYVKITVNSIYLLKGHTTELYFF